MDNILIKPVITEKSLERVSHGWYTFKMLAQSTKHKIKEAIEAAYRVNVVSVRVLSMKGKIHKVGRNRLEAKRSDWKKTLVRLKKGQTIDAFDVSGETGEGKK